MKLFVVYLDNVSSKRIIYKHYILFRYIFILMLSTVQYSLMRFNMYKIYIMSVVFQNACHIMHIVGYLAFNYSPVVGFDNI